MELERRGVQDLASAISAAESLIKFKKNSSKGQGKNNQGSAKGGGDWDKSPKKDKSFKDYGTGKKDDTPKRCSCFICNGPRRAFECLKKRKLATLV